MEIPNCSMFTSHPALKGGNQGTAAVLQVFTFVTPTNGASACVRERALSYCRILHQWESQTQPLTEVLFELSSSRVWFAVYLVYLLFAAV